MNKQKIAKEKYKKSHPWYTIIKGVRDRCNNPNHVRYYRYGGRGIKCYLTINEIKDLWFRDKAYLMDKPSIDRIDNNGHYIFANCRFIELRENLIKGNKETHCKSICQYDLEGNFIKEWESLTEASKKLNINIQNISQCICKRKSTYTAGGYIWRYKNDKLINIELYNNRGGKRVLQYDLENNFIKEWKTINEIERQLGFSHQAIGKCCKGIYKTSMGFIWKYKPKS